MSPAGRERDADDAAAAELAAVRLLALREHSRHELRLKLRDRRYEAGLVDRVLDDLERRRLLSDARFAEQYLAQRVRKGFGPLRIRAELEQRGVAGPVIAAALDGARPDWEALLLEAVARKFGERPERDLRGLARRGRFLEQRGFPIGLIRRHLERIRDL
jgi:regulatory protein